MSYECVADIVDIAVEKLPRVEILYERAKQAADRQKDLIIWKIVFAP
jgi:hypothetical protein